MTPDRWQQVKEMLADALERSDTHDRASFLVAACGDDTALRREVESLLSQPPDEFENCAQTGGLAHPGHVAAANTRRRLGAYELVRELGRGGMGTVWLGKRVDQQFEKLVAIKLLKRGTDTEEVVRRFQSERQILARLEHPSIARLIDGGTTDDGLPYFVMEYVVGSPVTEFCATNALPIEARLRLFLKICAAVQFAHQNLVVHRDLKPANILITTDGEPKLLDFGIAKLLAPGDGALSITIADQQRLTPAYASPEQVRGDPITTISDVYALGALLYEMLSGKPAHRFSNVHPSPTELLRVVGEQIPPRPSAVAVDPSTVRRLQGDLDNIVQKALRKEPERRYDGVGSLAADARRHLENFPVRARKDTLPYRTSKFIQRHRLGVAAGSLVLLAILIGFGATAWQAHVARAERRKAEQRFNQVRELAHSVLFDYHDAIAALPGSTSVRQRLVQDALKYLDNLAKEAGNDRSLLRELASAYEKVAAVQGGAAASTMGAVLSASNLGETAGAEQSSRKAVAIRERVSQLEPSKRQARKELADSYTALGGLYVLAGPPEKAVEFARKAVDIYQGLLAMDPGDEALLDGLATAYLSLAKALGSPGVPNLGDSKAALDYLDKAVVIGEKLFALHPNNLNQQQTLGTLHNTLGLMFSATGQRKEELAEYQKAAAIDQALVAADPGNTLFRRELAVQLGNVGSAMVQLKDKTGALEYFRQALAIYEALVAADPSDVSIRRNLAVGYRNVGVALGVTDRMEALRNFQKAAAIFAEIAAKDSKNDDFRRQWAHTYLATSRFQLEIDDLDGAVESALEGIRIDEALVAASPANASAQNTLALLYFQLGTSHVKWSSKIEAAKATQTEHWHNAKDAFVKSLNIYQEMKQKGTLTGADAGKPDEVAREIAKCDAALK